MKMRTGFGSSFPIIVQQLVSIVLQNIYIEKTLNEFERACTIPHLVPSFFITKQAPPSTIPSGASTALPTWTRVLDKQVLLLPRTASCFGKIEKDTVLDYKLPKPGALAGQVLKHVYATLDAHLAKNKPSIFKIGYTHCASWRYHNRKYGYIGDVEKWEGMTIVYVSHEPTGPAFVEAATIQRHIGFSVA